MYEQLLFFLNSKRFFLILRVIVKLKADCTNIKEMQGEMPNKVCRNSITTRGLSTKGL